MRDNIKETSIERFGSWYAQTEEHQRQNYQWKDFIMPSGKTVKYQGYEDKALMNY